MPRFLIEVSHDPGPAECTQAIKALQIVPSDFRARTRVILLHTFTLEQVTSRAERGVQ